MQFKRFIIIAGSILLNIPLKSAVNFHRTFVYESKQAVLPITFHSFDREFSSLLSNTQSPSPVAQHWR